MRFELSKDESQLPEAIYERRDVDAIEARVSQLSPRIGEMHWLRELDLRFGDLERLPDLQGLKSLETLKLGSNDLKGTPRALMGLPIRQLEIAIDGEVDGEVFGSFERLEELELRLRWTQHETLPAEVFAPTLTKLVLATWNSTLRSLEGLQRATGLKRLELSVAGLERLPGGLDALQALEHLQIGASELVELPEEVFDLRKLQSLRISAPALTELPPIGRMPELRNLEIARSSGLERAPEGLQTLEKLEALELSHLGLRRLGEVRYPRVVMKARCPASISPAAQ